MNLDKTGSLIATARKEQNMTQKALAEKLNISDKAVSKWERGLSFPDIAVLQTLSQVLKLSMIDLISGEQLEKESNETVADIVKNTVEISNSELKRKTRQYLRRMIVISICIIVALCILGFPFILAMQPADSQASVNEIQAKTFPSKHVLTIPMSTKTNPGDFFAYGFMMFSSNTGIKLMKENLEVLFGEENVSEYHSLGSDTLYSRILIKQQQDDGTIDYYSLDSLGIDGKKTRYIFTGMRYRFNYGQSDPTNIILPIHLIGDIRIGERNSITVVRGAEYELHPISIDNGEYKANYLELFYDFYSSLGWYTVVKSENSILITPKSNFGDAITLLIKITEHSGQAYFSVNIG